MVPVTPMKVNKGMMYASAKLDIVDHILKLVKLFNDDIIYSN